MRSMTVLWTDFVFLALLALSPLTKGGLTLDDQALQVLRSEFSAKLESYDAIISDLKVKAQRHEERIEMYETTVKRLHEQIAVNQENNEQAIEFLKQRLDQCEKSNETRKDMEQMKSVYSIKPAKHNRENSVIPVQPDHVTTRDTKRASVDEPPRQAAFYAELSSDLDHVGNYQTIVFDFLTTNIGNGYDTTDGEFTAPMSGIYVFIWTTTSRLNHSLQSELIVNGDVHGREWSRSDIYATTASATGCVVVRLNAGDDVWVRSTTIHDNHITGNRLSSFSGWLLY